MPRIAADSEDALAQATLALFRQMGWDTVSCLNEVSAMSLRRKANPTSAARRRAK